MTKYDAVVIGSGQGGNPLAHRLADLKWSVALIEEAYLGGTCINTGCTPTKTMVASAQIAHYARHAARWGVRAENVGVDLDRVVDRKNETVASFRSGQEEQVRQRKTLRLYRGHARFAGAHELEVNGQTIESDKIFIDVGARPAIPPIAGLPSLDYLTNANIMDLTELPRHLLVLGGGYVGLEFGQMFRRFGSEVTIIHQGGQILSREDAEIAAELQKSLESEGIRFLLNARTDGVKKTGGNFQLQIEQAPGTVTGSHLLVATGRVPNTTDLGLERAGIETAEAGFIKVNGRLETNVPGVWAIGDCKGGPAFTHISYNDYQIIFGNLIEGKNLSIDHRLVPYSVFTDPQLGGVGMTEKEARAQGYRLKIGRVPMSRVARAIERGETTGLMKIIVDALTGHVLGASILSAEGGELVQIISTLMLAGAPYTLLKGAIYIHPTLAEGFWTLMETVKDAD